MSRRTLITALTGAVLVGGLGAPALADPALPETEPTVVCVRTDPQGGEREGLCVWLPVRR